ncbi:MAG: GAF domain-containing protein, partial [Thermoanaerobaculia bacterium]|nr:GAF domain-containing protein [Thermoanaerobaculia bacterium]
MQDQESTDRSAFLLQALAEAGRATPGTELFPHLVRSLATALGLRYCFLTECLDSPASKVRTLAFWDGERIRDNFEYDLAGTPCRRVLGGAECRIGDGVRALFPDDLDLVDLAAESYAALPLLNTWGQVIGHLAVLDTHPFTPGEPDLALMRFCATRAGAELERIRLNQRLVRAHRLENGGPARGRVGARLQQRAHRHRRLRRAFARPATGGRRAPGRRRRDPRRRPPRPA